MSNKYTITWQAEDIQTLRPHWTVEQCENFLDTYFYKMQDGMISEGWNIIDYFLDSFDPSEAGV
jgi:hypothetical protein